MGIQEQEALARQLFRLFDEAVGYDGLQPLTWEQLIPKHREAWIQVAQFVEARSNEPLATDDNLITRIDTWVRNDFKNYAGIVPRQLVDFYDPDHK